MTPAFVDSGPELDRRHSAALNGLGVHFLEWHPLEPPPSALTTQALLAGLPRSGDARLRAAIISVLLWHPDLASAGRGRQRPAARAGQDHRDVL